MVHERSHRENESPVEVEPMVPKTLCMQLSRLIQQGRLVVMTHKYDMIDVCSFELIYDDQVVMLRLKNE
jgi:hypothetical protein